MKKLNVKIKKLLSLVIATFMTLSVTAGGFYELDLSGGNGYDGTAGTGLSNGAVAPNTPVKAVQTNKIMTENGKTDYKIVLPTNLGSWDNEAKNELVTFLRMLMKAWSLGKYIWRHSRVLLGSSLMPP